MQGPGARPRVVLLFLLTVGSCLVNSPYAVYLALYARSLGFTAVQWTLMNTGMTLVVSVSLLGLPTLVRRVGPRAVMIASYALMAACLGSIATHTRAGVTAGALAFGVSATAASMCVITELQKGVARVGRLNSAYTVVNGACSVIAPLLAALLVKGPGYRVLWLGSTAIMAVQAAACFLLPGRDGTRASAAPSEGSTAAPGLGPVAILLRSGFAPLLLGTAVLEPFSFQFVNLYYALRLSALGLPDATIGMVSSAAFALYLASSVTAFFVLDRLPVRAVLAACLACTALCAAGFGLAPSAAVAIAAYGAYQLFYGMLHPAKNTRLSRFATTETRHAFFSYTISVQSFSCAALNAAGSALVGTLGMQPLITGGALLAAGGGFVTLGAPSHMRGGGTQSGAPARGPAAAPSRATGSS